MSRPRYISGWKAEYRCIVCEMPMSKKTRLHSDGMCPYCAHQTRGTIIECEIVPYRLWTNGPWWKFGTDCKRVYHGEDPEQ